MNTQLLYPCWKLADTSFNNGNVDKAINQLKECLANDPGSITTLEKLAFYTSFKGDLVTSAKYYYKILNIDPSNKHALYNLGTICFTQRNLKLALKFLSKAYEINPDVSAALMISRNYELMKQSEKSEEWLYEALKLDPGHFAATYNILFHKMKNCDWSSRKEDEDILIRTLEEHLSSTKYDQIIPRLNFSLFDVPMNMHLKLNQYYSKVMAKGVNILKKKISFKHNLEKKKRLNIGYISPDFIQDHPVGRCLSELFTTHNRSRVKVHSYSLLAYNDQDPVSRAIAEGSDVFRDFSKLNHIDAAYQIYNDKIDILIDLAGHTSLNRLHILSLQPAPVQIHWLGYPDTTGQNFIQYFLADKYLVPNDLFSYYSERIWHLPSCFVYNRQISSSGTSHASSDGTQYSREYFGLPKNAFVFVNFNRSEKIEPDLFEVWMNILNGVPSSVLWLSDFSEIARNNILLAASAQGVIKHRIIFSRHLPYADYLESFGYGDLFLDTWHYSAGSTAMDALGKALPLLTCLADNNASRMGASIVAATGLPELICENLQEFQEKAIYLANNPSLLQNYRNHLRSPDNEILLFNNRQFAQNIEIAFGKIWEMSTAKC